MARIKIKHSDIRNDDVVHLQGHRFTVQNVRTLEAADPKANLIRYEVRCADPGDYVGHMYDGGTYGAQLHIMCTVER